MPSDEISPLTLNKMKKLLILVPLLLCSLTYAQENKGMHFEHADSWSEIKAKAKKENKYIFLDAFTTWCGPCKYMSANIFPMEEVGTFYNANYISVKVQIDSTAGDNPEVQKWRADAKYIAKTYEIRAYPTYLFFDPSGELVHRAVGSSDAATFISKGKAALEPSKQYYTLKRQYETGKKDADFILALVNASMEAYDEDFSAKVTNEYLSTQTDLTTPKNIRLLSRSTKKSTDPGFAVFRKNMPKVDSVLGEGSAVSMLKRIALSEMVYPALSGKDAIIDWAALETKLQAAYPEFAASDVILPLKARYYQSKKNWPEFNKAVTAYLNKSGDKINNMELNNFAWTVFENCKDGACVEEALAWSKKSLSGKDAKNPMFMDTYANILYKMGKKKEAIKMQEEALLVSNNDPNIKATLDKMKAGEKTWQEEE